MGNLNTLITTLTAVVGLVSAIAGAAHVVFKAWKAWRKVSSPPSAHPARRSRWRLGLVFLSAAIVVAVSLLFSAGPSPADVPRPAEVEDREVVLKSGPFSVTVPKVFDKAARDQAFPVTGSPVSGGWLVALSRKVGTKGWYAQCVTPIGFGMTVGWKNWSSEVEEAEVCLLEVSGELPPGLRPTGKIGPVSDETLARLPAWRTTRSTRLRIVHK